MTQNILVIGKAGQLARALKKEGQRQGVPLVFSNRSAVNLEAPARVLKERLTAYGNVQGIILAAAHTDVEAAEADEKTAQLVNGVAPGTVASFCKDKNIPFVHVSTDYVFDGKGTSPYRPSDPTSPLNIYGRSKKAGEAAIQVLGKNAAILRTSWVYDGTGKNFLTTMLNLANSRDTVRVVADQIGRPTYASHLARACLSALTTLQIKEFTEPQIFHVTNVGEPISWAGFAEAIFDNARQFLPNIPSVEPILSEEFPTAAKRPAYSVLDTSEFEDWVSAGLPSWEEGVRQAVLEYFAP